jgi:hypothetical protein
VLFFHKMTVLPRLLQLLQLQPQHLPAEAIPQPEKPFSKQIVKAVMPLESRL